MPVTKDALYGRRAYSKVMDGVFQEAYADTGSPHQREALARLAHAWAQLDETDPQGEFMLLKAMVDGLKNDSKLASALGIEILPVPAPAKHSSRGSETSYGGTTVHGPGTTRTRPNTKTSISSLTKAAEDYESASDRNSTGTPEDTPGVTPTSTIAGKGAKLVLAQNNPYLKSHRRRQSGIGIGEKPFAVDTLSALDEKKLPGHVEKGMEQQGLLADILYGQWMQGLRSRWPVT
jgi:serine/threonine-protein kinase 24/25/MST4